MRCGCRAAVAGDGTAVRHRVDVGLGERSYPIYIGEGTLGEGALVGPHLNGAAPQVLVVTNETVGPLYLDAVSGTLREGGRASGAEPQVEAVVLRDGEEFKTMDELMKVWDAALGLQYGRKATIVALGGGVIGDMAGFAAAAYQRGVEFIQVPTTLLAMVDSSVGGKTGVNHPLGKNMLGAFHQPQVVIIDTDSLDTLADKEFFSGLSEVVKYGLIRDAPFLKWMEQNWDQVVSRDSEALAYAVKRSCENKAEIVAADEREGGVRATLNLGHTFGHAIETWTGYGSLLHGEAISIGMMMANDLSLRMGWIDSSVCERTEALLRRANLPLESPEGMTPEDYMRIMARDKKNVDAKLRLVLLKGGVGECVITEDFDSAALQATLEKFCR